MTKETKKEKYRIKIIRRDLQQAGDDYHATVTRVSDGERLVFISPWKWWLKFRTRRWLLDREFKYYDKRAKKLAQVEELTR